MMPDLREIDRRFREWFGAKYAPLCRWIGNPANDFIGWEIGPNDTDIGDAEASAMIYAAGAMAWAKVTTKVPTGRGVFHAAIAEHFTSLETLYAAVERHFQRGAE